jgi:hypothetical protein
MNIFALDKEPKKAARMLCDKHVIKMTLETAQMLCSAFPKGEAPYKPVHLNHPCTIWARTSIQNYRWLISHGLAIANEYTNRYGKTHKSQAIIHWCDENKDKLNLPDIGLTPFALAMNEEIYGKVKHDNPIIAYQQYYRAKNRLWLENKGKGMKWSSTRKPQWMVLE